MFWLALIPFIILAVLPGVLQEAVRKFKKPNLSDILTEAYHFKYYEDSKGCPRPLREVCEHYKNLKF